MGVTLTTKLYICRVTKKNNYAPAAFTTSPEENCVNYLRPKRALPRQKGTCRVDGAECDALKEEK